MVGPAFAAVSNDEMMVISKVMQRHLIKLVEGMRWRRNRQKRYAHDWLAEEPVGNFRRNCQIDLSIFKKPTEARHDCFKDFDTNR